MPPFLWRVETETMYAEDRQQTGFGAAEDRRVF